MLYILDTNILVHFSRNSAIYTKLVEELDLFGEDNFAFISEVSIGEIYSIALINNWGEKRLKRIKFLLQNITSVPISEENIYENYARIDAFSKAIDIGISLPASFQAQKMGKNDLWIAATASVSGGVLITMDKDFAHLNDVFFKIKYIQQ